MNEKRFKRRSIRLPDFDYSQYGWYFVTVCTKNKTEHFGTYKQGVTELNDLGKIAERCWQDIPNHYPHVTIDEFVIMPNHVHGIIIITRSSTIKAENFQPLHHQFQHPIPRSLSSVIRGFKIGVTVWCRTNGHDDFQWQRNYFERVTHDDKELEHVRAYIRNNPTNWELDEENPVQQQSL